MHIFFPDSKISAGGYNSIKAFIAKAGCELTVNQDRAEWLSQAGNYEAQAAYFSAEYESIEHLSADELFHYEYKSLRLFPLVRTELLSAIIAKPDWEERNIPGSDDSKLFHRIFENDRRLLLLNYAAAISWLDFWVAKIKASSPWTHVFIVSGSLIYEKTLMGLMKTRDPKVMVIGNSFSPEHFFLEDKYDAIANKNRLWNSNFYNHLSVGNVPNTECSKFTHQSSSLSDKKNIESEAVGEETEISWTLILGQAADDPSILETRLEELNVVNIYFWLIDKILSDTNSQVALYFPSTANGNTTAERIKKRIQKHVDPSCRKRIRFISDESVASFYEQAEFVLGLNFQKLIEAACYGCKPIQLGNAYFGKKGLTYDVSELDAVISTMTDESISGRLNANEIRLLELFLTKTVGTYLVPKDESGSKKVRAHMDYPNLPLGIEVGTAEYIDRNLYLKKMTGSHRSKIRFIRKWRKFRRDPQAFFRDIKFKPLRILINIFSPKEH